MLQNNVGLAATVRYERWAKLKTGPFNFLTEPNTPEFEQMAVAFQKAISKDRDALLEFCEKGLFKQNTFYKENVEITSLTLGSSSNKVFGYTGTLHAELLATFMEALPEVGTDGKTIVAMEKRLIAGTSTVKSMPRDADLPNKVVEQFKNRDFNVFIDSGNWLKEVAIEDFAKRVLDECRRDDIEGVVFHDADGVEVCLERNQKKELSKVPFEFSRLRKEPERRLTIILSRFETGTDIPQRPTTQAFISVRKDMTLRDILQAAFRMRGILLGQGVSLMFSDEVKGHVAQSLLEGVLSHKEIADFIKPGRAIDLDALREVLKKLALPEGQEDYVPPSDEELSKLSDEERKKHAELKTKIYLPESLQRALLEAAADYNSKGTFEPLAFQESFNKAFSLDSIVSKDSSKTCWRYFAANLSKVEQDKNWAAAKHKMKDAFERPIRAILTNRSIPRPERLALFRAAKAVLVQHESDSRFEDLLKGYEDISADKAVKLEMKIYLDVYDKLLKELLKADLSSMVDKLKETLPREKLDTDLKACVSENLEELPKNIRILAGSTADRGGEIQSERQAQVQQEVQVEAQNQVQQQVNVEKQNQIQIQRVPPPDPAKYEPIAAWLKVGDKVDEKTYDVNSFFDKKSKQAGHIGTIKGVLPKNLTLPFTDKIEFSHNFILKGNVQLDSEEHAKNRLGARYILALKEGATTRYILVSHQDAVKIKRGILAGSVKGTEAAPEAVLLTLDGDTVVQSSKNAAASVKSEELAKALILSKFLTTKVNFSPSEASVFKNMVDNSANPLALRKTCREYYEKCLKYLEATNAQYNNSTLERVLIGKPIA